MAKDFFGTDDDELFFNGVDSGGFGDDRDMAQFETYQEIDIDNKQAEITKKAQDLVNSIVDTFFDAIYEFEDETDEKAVAYVNKLKTYIHNIKISEISVIKQLVKQIKVSEHLLDTLLRRLDGGGYKEDNLYNMIRDQQTSLNKFSIEFSKYVRTLPNYFEDVRTDMGLERSKIIENLRAVQQNNQPQLTDPNILTLSEGEGMETISEVYVSRPDRGTKGLAMRTQDALEQMKARYRETSDNEINFDPKDIEPKEEDIFEVERYVEEDDESGFE